FGIGTTFVSSGDPADYRAALTPRTKVVYAEVVANPSGVIADLEGLAAVARDAEIPLVVDSTVATPYLCRPIQWGADIVVHSATKFLGGHGTSLGGIAVESGRFDWGRWAGLPDNPYHERAKKYLPPGPGSVFSFGVVGGRAGGRAFIEALELCSHLANIGD